MSFPKTSRRTPSPSEPTSPFDSRTSTSVSSVHGSTSSNASSPAASVSSFSTDSSTGSKRSRIKSAPRQATDALRQASSRSMDRVKGWLGLKPAHTERAPVTVPEPETPPSRPRFEDLPFTLSHLRHPQPLAHDLPARMTMPGAFANEPDVELKPSAGDARPQPPSLVPPSPIALAPDLPSDMTMPGAFPQDRPAGFFAPLQRRDGDVQKRKALRQGLFGDETATPDRR